MLPTDSKTRKALPLYTFLMFYFPDAWLEMVKVAVAGNEQHNSGEPLHWAQGKSMDQLNTAMRHIMDHAQGRVYDDTDVDEPGQDKYLKMAGIDGRCLSLAKAMWRLGAEIQQLCNARREGIPLEALVRGSHEFLTSQEPATPRVADYMLHDPTQPSPPNMVVPALDGGGIAPLGTEPLEQGSWVNGSWVPTGPGSQLPTPTVKIPMPPVKTPRGRLLACGCFGNCAGLTPNCPVLPANGKYRDIG